MLSVFQHLFCSGIPDWVEHFFDMDAVDMKKVLDVVLFFLMLLNQLVDPID